MKITITEEQYQKLLEADLSYTPEKIKEFIDEAQTYLNNARMLKDKYYMNVTTLTISEVMEAEVAYQKLSEKMNSDHVQIESKYNRYYEIIEMYDFMNRPENVNYFEKINDKIYDIAQDIYHLSQALEEIVESIKYIRRADKN
jgi:heterodisulfide reductase subunit B